MNRKELDDFTIGIGRGLPFDMRWGTYAHALRNRQQELSLTAELDEEGKS